MKRVLIAGVCGMAGLLAACGGRESEQDVFAEELAELNERAEQQADAAAAERGSMAEAGDAEDPGAAAATSVTLPENFPDDVPLYPDMTLSSATGMSDTMMLQGFSEDDMETVTEFYRRTMASLDWHDESHTGASDIGMKRLRFNQEDRAVDISLTPSGDQTSINIALSPRL